MFLAACGSNGNGTSSTNGVGGSYYAVATTLNANTMQASSLIFTTPSLAAGATVDESQGIPVPDVVSLFGIEGSGRAYSTAAQTAVVTRYDVATNGTITPGPTVSFANFGLSGGFSTRSIVLVSPTKGYLFDDTTLQAITFDPDKMTTGKAIDLSAMKQTGYVTNFSYSIPVRNSTQIVVTAYYYDQTYSKSIPQTTVALIDTASDGVTVVNDTRCGDFSTIAAAPNGDLYFASDTYAGSLNRAGGTSIAPASCMLRMAAGSNSFDPNFFVTMSTLTGTKCAGGVVPGHGNSIWVRGFDETISPVTSTTTALQILGAPAWRWFQIDLANPTAPGTMSSFAPSAGELKYFIVGGHALVDNGSADFMNTNEVDMTASGAPVQGALVKGQTSGIVKVR
jgi:hypothetical protein